MRVKVLQFLADLVIKSLEREKNEMIFERLLFFGLYIDQYATEKGIYLN